MSPTGHFPRVRGTKGGLRRAPRIIPDRALHRPRAIQGCADGAQRIANIPRAGRALLREKPFVTVHVVRAAVIQDLRQRRGEILGVRRRAALDQHTVAVIRGADAAAAGHPVERVVGVAGRPVVQPVACQQERLVLHRISGKSQRWQPYGSCE